MVTQNFVFKDIFLSPVLILVVYFKWFHISFF